MRLVNRCYNKYTLSIGCQSSLLKGWDTVSDHIATISTDTLEHLRFQASINKYTVNVNRILGFPIAAHMATIDQTIAYLEDRFKKAKLDLHVRKVVFTHAIMTIEVHAYCTLNEFHKVLTVIRGVPLEEE